MEDCTSELICNSDDNIDDEEGDKVEMEEEEEKNI